MKKNKYCQVCKHFTSSEKCYLGYDEFCEQKRFESSAFNTVIDFIYKAWLADLNIPDAVYDELEKFAAERYKDAN